MLLTACSSNNDEEQQDPEEIYFQDYESPEDKWGYINTQGELTIPPVYDEASMFSEGFAAVNFKGKWGYIDTEGNPLTGSIFKSAWPMQEGIGRVLHFDGSWSLVDNKGNLHRLDVDEVFDVSEDRLRFLADFRYGYLDPAGQVVIEPQFEQARDFSGSYARVTVNGKIGLIDTEGNFVLEPVYDRVKEPGDGYAGVVEGGNAYFIDLETGYSLAGNWEKTDRFVSGVAAVTDSSGTYLIEKTGQRISASYESLRYAGKERWVARKDNHYALLDANGRQLCDFRFGHINNFSGGFAAYQRDDLWGYINPDCEPLTPPVFGLAWDFSNGYARAAFQDGIAYLDSLGEVPFLPNFREIRDFHEGLAAVQAW